MFGWIKRLWKRYKRFTLEQYDMSPVVYKIGTRRYIRTKEISNKPIPRKHIKR